MVHAAFLVHGGIDDVFELVHGEVVGVVGELGRSEVGTLDVFLEHFLVVVDVAEASEHVVALLEHGVLRHDLALVRLFAGKVVEVVVVWARGLCRSETSRLRSRKKPRSM